MKYIKYIFLLPSIPYLFFKFTYEFKNKIKRINRETYHTVKNHWQLISDQISSLDFYLPPHLTVAERNWTKRSHWSAVRQI